MYFIYLLSDPVTGKPHYVGKSKNVRRRLSQHIAESFNLKGEKDKWINALWLEGKMPLVSILAEAENEYQSCEHEAFWVAFYQHKGIFNRSLLGRFTADLYACGVIWRTQDQMEIDFERRATTYPCHLRVLMPGSKSNSPTLEHYFYH